MSVTQKTLQASIESYDRDFEQTLIQLIEELSESQNLSEEDMLKRLDTKDAYEDANESLEYLLELTAA